MNTQKTWSPKDFHKPLALVMLQLSGGSTSAVIPMIDTFPPIMDILGITALDAYGKTSEGHFQVARWIQQAFKNLKRRGAMASAGVGKWMITQVGIEAARKAVHARAPVKDECPESIRETETMETETVETADVETVDVETVDVETVEVHGRPSIVTRGYDEGGYHPDPYIRALAFTKEVTPCYGHFTERSPKCGTCPARGACIGFQAAEFSKLASILAEEDKKEATRLHVESVRKAKEDIASKDLDEALPTDPTMAPVGDEIFDEDLPDGFDFSQCGPPTYMVNSHEVNCSLCGKALLKGTDGIWFRSKDHKGTGGAFHWDCVPQHLRPFKV